MLIECDRHRPDDLAHWRSLEAGDLMYVRANKRRLDRLVSESLRFMREFVAAGPCYQGVSWGKDSVVLAELARREGVTIPLVWVCVDGAENPHCTLVRDAWLDAHPSERERYVEIHAEAGRRDGGTSKRGFEEAAKRFGDRYLSGVRRDESRARNMRYLGHGANSARTSAPLSNWRNEDIFAFCARERLPLHPVYAMSLGGQFPREHIRTASLGGSRGAQFGRREWEMVYYRDELASQGRDHYRIG